MKRTCMAMCVAAAALAATPVVSFGQNNDMNNNNNNGATAGQRVDRAADRTGDAARDAGDRAANTADKAMGHDRMSAGMPAGVALPNGIQAKELKDGEDIRDLLAVVAEAALTKDGFDDLVERLADQDRNRIGRDIKNLNLEKLNGRIDQIRTAYKAKYGRDFDVGDEEGVYGRVAIMQGEVTDGRAAMAGWPLKAGNGSAIGNMAQPAGSLQNPNTTDPNVRPNTDGATAPRSDMNNNNTNANAGGRANDGSPMREDAVEAANLERGREVAVAAFPSAMGGMLPQTVVSLVGETTAWRIDVPNTVTAQRLHDNLLNHLTQVGEMSAQWPADEKQAQADITHHVLMALYDLPVSGAQGQGAGSGTMNQPMPGGNAQQMQDATQQRQNQPNR